MPEVFGQDAKALQELHVQRELLDRPPFNQPMKKLVDAFKCVERGRVRPAPDAANVWLVQGSKGDPYQVDNLGCSCPHGQHSHNTKYGCYHSVAVELYQRWQRAMQPMLALPLGPSTPDEHLAQSRAAGPKSYYDVGSETVTVPAHVVLQSTISTPDASADVPTPEPVKTDSQPLQEYAMAAPRDDEFIPEPAPAVGPTILLDEAPTTQALTVAPSLSAASLEQSLTEWSQQRQVMTQFIRQHLVEGTDFYKLKVGNRETKPTLGKAGAEKFMGLFQLQASFRKDSDTWEMLGSPAGTLCYICTLHTRSGEIVGEGRGARDIKKDGGDLNKTVKMTEKSSLIDAILRTGALSDAFTQDRDPEDMLPDHAEASHTAKLSKGLETKYERRAFKEEYGYSTNAHYDTGGLREDVLRRDGFACVMCGMTDAQHKAKWQRPITIDHMDKNRDNNTMENLQTLCLSCHGSKDILPELTEQQVVKFKDDVLQRRGAGESYKQIADDLGFSIASIWKWHRRWTGIDTPQPSTAVLRQEIAKALKALGFQGTTKAEYEAEVLRRTGLALHPDAYVAILDKLRTAVDTQVA